MAITFIQAAIAGSGGTAATTRAVTISAVAENGFICGVVAWGSVNSGDLISISDNAAGNPNAAKYVIVNVTTDVTNSESASIFYGWNLTGGPTVITATFGTSLAYTGLSVQEFSGVKNASAPLDGINYQSQVETPSTASNDLNSGTGTQTPSINECLIIGAAVNCGAVNQTGLQELGAGTSFTEPTGAEYFVSNELSFATEYWIQTTATAVNASWTASQTVSHIALQAIFLPADAGPPPQYSRPDVDVSDGTWVPSTGTDNFAVIDETTFSDADYVSTDSNSTMRVGMSSLSTPDAGTQTFKIRAGGSIAKKLIARLIEGASTVRGTITVDPLTSAIAAYSVSPSAIVDYSDLDVELEIQDATSPPANTITFGAIGTAGTVTNTTTHNVNYPTGITSTDALYLFMSGMSGTAGTQFAITGGGWTLIGTLEGGSGATYGIDVGNRRVSIYRKDTVTGSESGNITVTLTGTSNTIFGSIIRVSAPSGYSITQTMVTGADTTAGTAYSATASSNLSYQPGDLLAVLVASSTDAATQSAQAISSSGITFGTRTNRRSTAATGGNDHRHILDTIPVNAGTTSSAPTYSYTASISTSGPAGFLLIRAVPPTEFGRVSFVELEVPESSAPPAAKAPVFIPFINRMLPLFHF